jgi:hypothetical protein
MILGGGPNPRCSRRRDLGRLVGWGLGVGEGPVRVVLVRAAELKPLGFARTATGGSKSV